jgi:hypothetical protein
MGQAAGTAAAMAADSHGGEVRRVNVAALREALVARGALV